MPKPNKVTEFRNVRLGQYYDWHDTQQPTSYLYGTEGTYYNMPISSNHKKINGIYVTGGDWLSHTSKTEYGGDDVTMWRPGWGVAYKGKTRCNYPIARFSEVEIAGFLKDTQNKGAEAWAKMKPAQPEFSAAVSIAELREVPSMLGFRMATFLRSLKRTPAGRKFRKRPFDPQFHKVAAGGHVAIQFGWIPLYRDLTGFVETFLKRKKLFEQLLKDEGRPVKRSVKISSPPDTVKIYNLNNGAGGHNTWISPALVSQCYAGRSYNHLCTTQIIVETKYKTWAKGKFRYYLPSGPRNAAWKRKIMARLFGGRITPDAVYNLIPWSWFVDYFTDVGKFVQAISGGVEENLYAEYAYVMRTITRTTTVISRETYRINKAGNGSNYQCFVKYTDRVKIRVKANPFGFGFSEKDLSPKQQGILVALGILKT